MKLTFILVEEKYKISVTISNKSGRLLGYFNFKLRKQAVILVCNFY